MKFGIFYIVQWHESRTQEQALREALDVITRAWTEERLTYQGKFALAAEVVARVR